MRSLSAGNGSLGSLSDVMGDVGKEMYRSSSMASLQNPNLTQEEKEEELRLVHAKVSQALKKRAAKITPSKPLQTLKAVTPGPGAYSNFDLNRSLARRPAHSFAPKLITHWERHTKDVMTTKYSPGPGMYDNLVPAEEINRNKKPHFSMKPDLRAQSETYMTKTPGPGNYDVATHPNENISATVKSRFQILRYKELATPGPKYNIKGLLGSSGHKFTMLLPADEKTGRNKLDGTPNSIGR